MYALSIRHPCGHLLRLSAILPQSEVFFFFFFFDTTIPLSWRASIEQIDRLPSLRVDRSHGAFHLAKGDSGKRYIHTNSMERVGNVTQIQLS